MGSYGIIRMLLLFGLTVIVILIRKKTKKREDNKTSESLENYTKDENGLYPWEKNTDDSPENIPPDAKVFKEKDKIKRSRRW